MADYKSLEILTDKDGKPIPQEYDPINNKFVPKTNEPENVQLTGSSVDQRGLAANKPLATDVEIGTTYWSVDTDPQGNAVEISDGASWVVL